MTVANPICTPFQSCLLCALVKLLSGLDIENRAPEIQVPNCGHAIDSKNRIAAPHVTVALENLDFVFIVDLRIKHQAVRIIRGGNSRPVTNTSRLLVNISLKTAN